jgi:membrane-bound lytic murein transglycosylase
MPLGDRNAVASDTKLIKVGIIFIVELVVTRLSEGWV